MVGKEQWAVSDLGTLCTAILNLVLNLNGLSTTYIGGFPHSDLSLSSCSGQNWPLQFGVMSIKYSDIRLIEEIHTKV